ncbi:MAG: potassium transporter TrkH, partial [Victivallales bacterium]|nr:potassium transporter TrkH [Victivallales bacterium]
ASLGNIGPGIGKVGAACTYAWLAPSAKILLTLAMLLGRLEVYTVLVVILPTFWRR